MSNHLIEQPGFEPIVQAADPAQDEAAARQGGIWRVLTAASIIIGLTSACNTHQDQPTAAHNAHSPVAASAVTLPPPEIAPAAINVKHAATGKMVIFGDSITARYGKDSSAPNGEGWWAELAHEADLTPVTSAISGTGFIRRSQDCKAPTFSERLKNRRLQLSLKDAKIVVIEGGRNDYHKCVDGKSVPTTQHDVDTSSRQFFAEVLKYHKDPASIYVITPWGPRFPEFRKWIIPIVEKNAEDFKFNWVSTAGVLTKDNTVDLTHPTSEGSVALCRSVIEGSNIISYAKSIDNKPKNLPAEPHITDKTCQPTAPQTIASK